MRISAAGWQGLKADIILHFGVEYENEVQFYVLVVFVFMPHDGRMI